MERDYRLDVLRSISMIMVILIHVANCYCRSFGDINNLSYIFSVFINIFSRISVPIFFMISGTLLVRKDFDKNKYLKRLFKLLIPIIIWNIIYLVWEYFYLGITYKNLLHLLVEPYRKHLWFLYTLIVLYSLQPLLSALMDYFDRNKKIRYISLLLWIVLCNLCFIYTDLTDSLSLFCYGGYFIIGRYLYESYGMNKKKLSNVLLIVSFFIVLIVDVYLSYKLSFKEHMFYNVYYSYRGIFVMILSFISFIFVLQNMKSKKTNDFISLLCTYSFGIYLIHGIFLDITIKTVGCDIISIIGIPLHSLFVFCASLFSLMLINKIPKVGKYLSTYS